MISLDTVLEKLKNSFDLTYDESYKLFTLFIKGEIKVDTQVLILQLLSKKTETPIEISAAATALVDNSKKFPEMNCEVVDIVGTGGDGLNTINISTTSAIIAAAAGYKVAKHGGRSVSSKSGSFDLLESMGVNIHLSPEDTKTIIQDTNLGFLFAPFYNDGFKNVKEARALLKSRTIFNILGPLINPVRPTKALIGVHSKELILPMAKTLLEMGMAKALIVHGSGLDEVAIHGITNVAEINNGNIKEYIVSPEDFGVEHYGLDTIEGGEPSYNASIIKQILLGKGTDAHNCAVAVNVALMMRLYGKQDLKENTHEILELIKSGIGFEKLIEIINFKT